jgi:hypothetical protein
MRVKPPTSGEDEEHSEGRSFGDMDVDDDFWGELDQIEDVGRIGGNGRISVVSASTQTSRTAISNRFSGAAQDVIALDDDENGHEGDDWVFGNGGNKENVSDSHPRVTPPSAPLSQPRPGHRPPSQFQEVIELSD